MFLCVLILFNEIKSNISQTFFNDDVNNFSFIEQPGTLEYPQNVQRRSSVPVDPSSTGRSNNGKRRNKNKILRRRSSGGAETILSPILSESLDIASTSSTWFRSKRSGEQSSSRTESILSKRRGSLPADVLSIGYSSK